MGGHTLNLPNLTKDGRAELWHTRLESVAPNKIPGMRVVWSISQEIVGRISSVEPTSYPTWQVRYDMRFSDLNPPEIEDPHHRFPEVNPNISIPRLNTNFQLPTLNPNLQLPIEGQNLRTLTGKQKNDYQPMGGYLLAKTGAVSGLVQESNFENFFAWFNIPIPLRPQEPLDSWVMQPYSALMDDSAAKVLKNFPLNVNPLGTLQHQLVALTNWKSGNLPWVELPAENVLITSIGGCLKTSWDFGNPINLPNSYIFEDGNPLLPIPSTNEKFPNLTTSLKSFHHQHYLGRDQSFGNQTFTRVIPFGHKAIAVAESFRTIEKGQAIIKHTFTMRIVENLVIYPDITLKIAGHFPHIIFEQIPDAITFSSPFKSIKIITKDIPLLLNSNGEARAGDGTFFKTADTGVVFNLRYEAIDYTDNKIYFDLPLKINPTEHWAYTESIPLNQQTLAFAIGDGETSFATKISTSILHSKMEI